MTPDEIIEAVLHERVVAHEGFVVEDARYIDGSLVVNDYAILPITAVSSGVNKESDIEIVDPADASLATLCFTKRLGNVPRSDLTQWQFMAFLADAYPEEIEETHYSFKSDYVVVDRYQLDTYKNNYASSAPIWGRFTHDMLPVLEHVTGGDKIKAVPGIQITTHHHREALGRYLLANNPLDRFLRLYHSIELLFDYVLVKKVKCLDDNLGGFSQIFSDFGKSELDRLKAIMKEFCGNTQSIVSIIQTSSEFDGEREDIFYKYGKKDNPFPRIENWEKFKALVDGGNINEVSMRNNGFISRDKPYDIVITDLAAYWIYRIRCSIAHNKIGEFLLEDRHYPFVANFCEPLILDVCKQVFSNPSFHSL